VTCFTHHCFFPVEMDSSFSHHIKLFAPYILSRDRLVVKTINGAPLTGKMLHDVFGVSLHELRPLK
jgi:hypothetical protein